jgi:hypothetical protein
VLLYADENFPLDVAEELRRLGHDVLTAEEDGRANRRVPDESVLERGVELGRAILTINRLDFKRLHRRSPDHAGIIICTYDPDFTGQARRIDEAIEKTGELKGNLVRVYRPSK